MSECDNCLSFFDNSRDRDNKFAENLDAQHNNCACEENSVSQFSPGIVGDEEFLYRILVAPKDASENAVSHNFLSEAESIGVSVLRSNGLTQDNIETIANEVMKRLSDSNGNIRYIHGVVKIPVKILKNFNTKDIKRVWCIYDSAREDVITHCDIFNPYKNFPTKSQILRHRSNFFNDNKNILNTLCSEHIFVEILEKYNEENRKKTA